MAVRCLKGRYDDAVVSRFLIAYLVFYFAAVAGAVVTLWHAGLVDEIGRPRVYMAIAAAVALGALLVLVSRKPKTKDPVS